MSLRPDMLMTTRKPYHGQDGPVTFGRPVIGPRVYLVQGPSGWLESFQRKLADKALLDFIAPLDLVEIITSFWTSMDLSARKENWEDVVSYLGGLTQRDPKTIPEIVGVAFWGQALLHEDKEEVN